MACSVDGCVKKIECVGLCSMHYQRFRSHGHTNLTQRKRGTNDHGYLKLRVNGKSQMEHRLVAEQAIGRGLPMGAVVHHIDGHRNNNTNSNLVICQDRAYHHLLHRRHKGLTNAGNVNFRRCCICQTWKDESDFYMRGNGPESSCKQCANVITAIRHRERRRHNKQSNI